jgi:hypothetical protein
MTNYGSHVRPLAAGEKGKANATPFAVLQAAEESVLSVVPFGPGGRSARWISDREEAVAVQACNSCAPDFDERLQACARAAGCVAPQQPPK